MAPGNRLHDSYYQSGGEGRYTNVASWQSDGEGRYTNVAFWQSGEEVAIEKLWGSSGGEVAIEKLLPVDDDDTG
jgi:hypothetical protein